MSNLTDYQDEYCDNCWGPLEASQIGLCDNCRVHECELGPECNAGDHETMEYEIKVRAPQYQSLSFEVWCSGVRLRVYKRRSSAMAYIARVSELFVHE